MAEEISQDQNEFAKAWTRFVQAARRLLAGAPSERVLGPYVTLRDATLDAAEDPKVTTALQNRWKELDSPSGEKSAPEVAHLLLREVEGFSAAVEMAEAEEEEESTEPLLSKKRLLGIGKTTVDSLLDIYEDLPLYVKGPLIVLSEVFSLFRGD